MCNYLLDEGADILMLNNKGMTVYGAAALDGHAETAIQLSNIALVEALIVGNAQRVLDTVADGADPDVTTSTGHI
jgi:ankyrin repeat protein